MNINYPKPILRFSTSINAWEVFTFTSRSDMHNRKWIIISDEDAMVFKQIKGVIIYE